VLHGNADEVLKEDLGMRFKMHRNLVLAGVQKLQVGFDPVTSVFPGVLPKEFCILWKAFRLENAAPSKLCTCWGPERKDSGVRRSQEV
jgi:hypothetical protein